MGSYLAELYPGEAKTDPRDAWVIADVARTHPESRSYYDKKRREGKCHNAAVICLARRRCDLVWALCRDQRCYEERSPSVPAAA